MSMRKSRQNGTASGRRPNNVPSDTEITVGGRKCTVSQLCGSLRRSAGGSYVVARRSREGTLQFLNREGLVAFIDSGRIIMFADGSEFTPRKAGRKWVKIPDMMHELAASWTDRAPVVEGQLPEHAFGMAAIGGDIEYLLAPSEHGGMHVIPFQMAIGSMEKSVEHRRFAPRKAASDEVRFAVADSAGSERRIRSAAAWHGSPVLVVPQPASAGAAGRQPAAAYEPASMAEHGPSSCQGECGMSGDQDTHITFGADFAEAFAHIIADEKTRSAAETAADGHAPHDPVHTGRHVTHHPASDGIPEWFEVMTRKGSGGRSHRVLDPNGENSTVYKAGKFRQRTFDPADMLAHSRDQGMSRELVERRIKECGKYADEHYWPACDMPYDDSANPDEAGQLAVIRGLGAGEISSLYRAIDGIPGTRGSLLHNFLGTCMRRNGGYRTRVIDGSVVAVGCRPGQ